MALSNLASMFAGTEAGSKLSKTIAASNSEAEMEIGAAELERIKSDKDQKVTDQRMAALKNRVSSGEKNAASIQF